MKKNTTPGFLFFLLLAFCFSSCKEHKDPSWDLKRTNKHADSVATDSLAKKPAQAPKVVGAYRFGPDSGDQRRNTAGIGDIIVIKVRNLDSLLKRAKCQDANGKDIDGC